MYTDNRRKSNLFIIYFLYNEHQIILTWTDISNFPYSLPLWQNIFLGKNIKSNNTIKNCIVVGTHVSVNVCPYDKNSKSLKDCHFHLKNILPFTHRHTDVCMFLCMCVCTLTIKSNFVLSHSTPFFQHTS